MIRNHLPVSFSRFPNPRCTPVRNRCRRSITTTFRAPATDLLERARQPTAPEYHAAREQVFAVLDDLFYEVDGLGNLKRRLLPDFTTTMAVLNAVYRSEQQLMIWYFEQREIYQIFTVEFVQEIARALKPLLCRPDEMILEICAGDGVLARGLQQHGLNVLAVDDQSVAAKRKKETKPMPLDPKVKRIDARRAIRQFRPRIVLGSWLPVRYFNRNTEILCKPWVEYFFSIEMTRDFRRGMVTPFGSSILWRYQDLEGLNRFATDENCWLKQDRSFRAYLYHRVKGMG